MLHNSRVSLFGVMRIVNKVDGVAERVLGVADGATRRQQAAAALGRQLARLARQHLQSPGGRGNRMAQPVQIVSKDGMRHPLSAPL